MTKKNKRRLRLPNASREYADIDYLDKLSPEDREYMLDFIDGYYNNNHRKYPMFTEHENAESIKKDIYDMTNARNRCSQSKGLANGSIMELDKPVGENQKLRIEDLLRNVYKDRTDDDILKVLGVTGFKQGVEVLIDNTLHELTDYSKDHEVVMLRFYLGMKKLVKNEKKRVLNEKKIAKEREERVAP